MTETQIKYVRMMMEDLSINSHDSMQMIALYADKTGLDCPLLPLLHQMKQDLAVQDDEQQVEQLDAMRQDLLAYLRWRVEHAALDASAILAGIAALPASLQKANAMPMAESLLGTLMTGKILAQNRFLASNAFMPQQFARIVGMLPDTTAGKQWRHWLLQLAAMFTEQREEDLLTLAQKAALPG